MSDFRPKYEDEIDLFELFETLLDGKWLISAVVSIAVLLGGCFILIKEDIYESKLFYSINSMPPYNEEDKVLADFQRKFYSSSVFKEWKQKNSNSSLLFDNLSSFEEVDGFILLKDPDKQLIKLISEKQDGSFILLRSNHLSLLDDLFKYAVHINQELTHEYIERAKEEQKLIEARFKDLNKTYSNIFEISLAIDRYIDTADDNGFVFAIQRPTIPKKVSIKDSLVLAFSVFFGGIIGVMLTLVRDHINKRKKQSAVV